MADDPIDIESFWNQTRPPRVPEPPRDMSRYAKMVVDPGTEEGRLAASLRDNMDRIRRGREEEALLASGATVPLPDQPSEDRTDIDLSSISGPLREFGIFANQDTVHPLADQVTSLVRQRVGEVLQRLPRVRPADEMGERLFSALESRAWRHLIQPGTNMDSLTAFMNSEMSTIQEVVTEEIARFNTLNGEATQAEDEMLHNGHLRPTLETMLRITGGHVVRQLEDLDTPVPGEFEPVYESPQEGNLAPREEPLEEALDRLAALNRERVEVLRQPVDDAGHMLMRPNESSDEFAQRIARVRAGTPRRAPEGPVLSASWMDPPAVIASQDPNMTNLVRAFTALGLPIDSHLELRGPGSSILTLVIDGQTIRLETDQGITRVRVFDRLR